MLALRLRIVLGCAVALLPYLRADADARVGVTSLETAVERNLTSAERRMSSSAIHDAEFAALNDSVNRDVCQANSQPQALATPDPLLGSSGAQSRIIVSFIIGTDGHIQSPLILSSDAPSEDRDILRTVKSWRYRPALCNGVPTEAEARVEFSSR